MKLRAVFLVLILVFGGAIASDHDFIGRELALCAAGEFVERQGEAFACVPADAVKAWWDVQFYLLISTVFVCGLLIGLRINRQ